MKKLLWSLLGVVLCFAIISPASALVWQVAYGGYGHDYHTLNFERLPQDISDIEKNLNGYADSENTDFWITGEANDHFDNSWNISNSEQFLNVGSDKLNWGWNDEGNLGNMSAHIAEIAHVPEPGTIVLMGFGLLGLATIGRKKFFQS